MRRRRPSDETLVMLRGKLEDLPVRSAERQHVLQECADLHGVSVATSSSPRPVIDAKNLGRWRRGLRCDGFGCHAKQRVRAGGDGKSGVSGIPCVGFFT